MHSEQRYPLDLVDQIYTMAYWMTGSLKKTNSIVYRTFECV
jgi:hypothetical protein